MIRDVIFCVTLSYYSVIVVIIYEKLKIFDIEIKCCLVSYVEIK